MSATQYTVSVLLKADASQYTATFGAAEATAAGFSAKVAGSGAAAATGLQAVVSQAERIAPALDNASAGIAAGLKGASTAGQSLGVSLAGVGVAGRKAGDEAAAGIDTATLSTKQYTAALRGVPAQMTDIVTGLMSGQAPMTVLIQQGGQLKDMFGGAGNAARAIGGYVAGLISPTAVVLAGAAAIALAYAQGSKEAQAFEQTVIMSGTAAGQSASQLMDMAAAIDQSNYGITQSRAAEALNGIAAAGDVGADRLERYTKVALQFEQTGAGSAEAVGKAFSDLAGDPLAASEKLNKSTHYLTLEVYNQIRALEDQGKKTEAARVAQDAYASMLEQRIPKLEANLGTFERAWAKVNKTAAEAWDSILGVGRAETLSSKLGDAEAQLAKMKSGGYSWSFGMSASDRKAAVAAQEEEVRLLQARIKGEKDAAALQAERNAAVEAGIALSRSAVKYEGELEQQRRKVLEVTAQYEAAMKNDTLTQAQRVQLEKDYLKAVSGITEVKSKAASAPKKDEFVAGAAAAQDWAKWMQELANASAEADGKLSDLTAHQVKLVEYLQSPGYLGATSEMQQSALEGFYQQIEREQALLQKQRQQQLDASRAAELTRINGDAANIEQKTAALEAETAAWGKSKSAIEAAALAQMQANAADLAFFGGSDDVVAALNNRIEAQKRYVDALRQSETKSMGQRDDEVLRQAKELAAQYQDEYRLVGLSALEREKIVAARAVELKYAKLLADIDRSSLTDADKEAERAKLNEARVIELSATQNKVLQADAARTSQIVEQSLTDALMRGFENGKDGARALADATVAMFKTLVLRPIIQAVVQPIAGSITDLLGLGGGGGGLFGSLGNNWLSSLLTGSSGAYGVAMGSTAWGAGSQAAMLAAQTGEFGLAGLTATAEAAGSALGGFTAALNSIPGWGWAIAAGLAILGGLDDSGTMHTGGAAQYSARGGLRTSTEHNAFGTGFGGVDFGQAGTDMASGIAKGVANMLDSVATTFGRTAGYEVAAAVADDSSEDGAWGGLLVRDGAGNVVINWNDTRSSRWAPKEFADGEAGAAEYATAVAVDVRDYLITQTPGWADEMLEALGDSPTLAQLEETVTEINRTQNALVKLGRIMPWFAGMSEDAQGNMIKAAGGIDELTAIAGEYHQVVYSGLEQIGIGSRALSDDFAELGFAMPRTRKELRDWVEAIDTSTEEGAKKAADLMALADGWGEMTDQMTEFTGLTRDSLSGMFKGIVKDAKSAEEARQMAEEQSGQLFMDAILNSMIGSVVDGLMTSVMEPISASLVASAAEAAGINVAGAANAGAAVATGGATAGAAVAAGGAAAGSNVAVGGAVGGSNVAVGGAMGGGAVAAGGAAAGAAIAAATASAVATIKAFTEIMSSPEWQEAFAEFTKGMGNVGAEMWKGFGGIGSSIGAGGGGGWVASGGGGSGTGGGGGGDSEANKQRDAWQEAYNVLEKAVAAQRELAQEQLDNATAVLDISQDAVKTLRNSVDDSVQMSARRGVAFIDQALGALKTEGYLPDPEQYKDAVQAAVRGVESKQYSNSWDAKRDALVLAAKLDAIAKETEPQKTAAEQQVEYLDGLLETAKEQLDALNGNTVAVMSLAEAIENWAKATGETLTGGELSDTPGGPETGGGGGVGNGGNGGNTGTVTLQNGKPPHWWVGGGTPYQAGNPSEFHSFVQIGTPIGPPPGLSEPYAAGSGTEAAMPNLAAPTRSDQVMQTLMASAGAKGGPNPAVLLPRAPVDPVPSADLKNLTDVMKGMATTQRQLLARLEKMESNVAKWERLGLPPERKALVGTGMGAGA